MERSIDSHQWASKTEIRRLLSGKLDLKTKADARTADDEPTVPTKSLPLEHFLFVGSLM
jgi:hypothetical protein